MGGGSRRWCSEKAGSRGESALDGEVGRRGRAAVREGVDELNAAADAGSIPCVVRMEPMNHNR